ncbi:MAG: hypothetical protein AAF251_06705 [Pseudomonadota bacterium]
MEDTKKLSVFSEGDLELGKQALNIMKSWRWVRIDPDNRPYSSAMMFHTALNRLAYDGVEYPSAALLVLCATGAIEARGDFQWTKLHGGEMFKLDGMQTTIEPRRWQELRKQALKRQELLEEGNLESATIDLPKTGYSQRPLAEWEPKFDSMSYVGFSGGDEWSNPDYFEEIFSAEHLAIFPLALPDGEGGIVGIADEAQEEEIEPQATTEATSQLGRRPKYDWPAATLAIFGRIHRGDFKPESQADVERALIDHLAKEIGSPSESTVRPYAKLIWTESQKA